MPVYLGECGDCLNCKSGKSNLCHVYPLNLSSLLPDGTSRMSISSTGEKLYHHLSCSTWSEYTVFDSHYMVKVDPNLPLPHASFLSCGFTTGFGSAWRTASVEKGSTVAVLGLGAVGLGVSVSIFYFALYYYYSLYMLSKCLYNFLHLMGEGYWCLCRQWKEQECKGRQK